MKNAYRSSPPVNSFLLDVSILQKLIHGVTNLTMAGKCGVCVRRMCKRFVQSCFLIVTDVLLELWRNMTAAKKNQTILAIQQKAEIFNQTYEAYSLIQPVPHNCGHTTLLPRAWEEGAHPNTSILSLTDYISVVMLVRIRPQQKSGVRTQEGEDLPSSVTVQQWIWIYVTTILVPTSAQALSSASTSNITIHNLAFD